MRVLNEQEVNEISGGLHMNTDWGEVGAGLGALAVGAGIIAVAGTTAVVGAPILVVVAVVAMGLGGGAAIADGFTGGEQLNPPTTPTGSVTIENVAPAPAPTPAPAPVPGGGGGNKPVLPTDGS
jgi:hypothetical protein